MTSENSNAKRDQHDDRKFLIPCEHIKRNKKKRNQLITGKGYSTGNAMGAPEPVRHLFLKRISNDTNDEDVFTMMEQNGFTVKELKYTRKFTRRASKRRCVLFAAVWREPSVIIRRVLFAAGWGEKPGVVCYHI